MFGAARRGAKCCVCYEFRMQCRQLLPETRSIQPVLDLNYTGYRLSNLSLGPNFCAPTFQTQLQCYFSTHRLRNSGLDSNQFVLSCAETESLELQHWQDLSNCLGLRALLWEKVIWIMAQSGLALQWVCRTSFSVEGWFKQKHGFCLSRIFSPWSSCAACQTHK